MRNLKLCKIQDHHHIVFLEAFDSTYNLGHIQNYAFGTVNLQIDLQGDSLNHRRIQAPTFLKFNGPVCDLRKFLCL